MIVKFMDDCITPKKFYEDCERELESSGVNIVEYVGGYDTWANPQRLSISYEHKDGTTEEVEISPYDYYYRYGDKEFTMYYLSDHGYLYYER